MIKHFFKVLVTLVCTTYDLTLCGQIYTRCLLDSIYSISLSQINNFDSINHYNKINEINLKGSQYQKQLDRIIFKNWDYDTIYLATDSTYLFYSENKYSDKITNVYAPEIKNFKLIIYESVCSYYLITLDHSFKIISFILWSESTPTIYNIKNGNGSYSETNSKIEKNLITQKQYTIKEYRKTNKTEKKLIRIKKFLIKENGVIISIQ
ncbi:MAG: hypothetical protein U0V72_07725 [Cytophagales bacterium]